MGTVTLTNDDVQKILERTEAASPEPWFWNSYSLIASGPLVSADEDGIGYPEDVRPGPPWFNMPGGEADADWMRRKAQAYEEDSTVAWVPAHYGDTATGRHAKDAVFIEAARTDVPNLAHSLLDARAEVERLRIACARNENEIEQILGAALGTVMTRRTFLARQRLMGFALGITLRLLSPWKSPRVCEALPTSSPG